MALFISISLNLSTLTACLRASIRLPLPTSFSWALLYLVIFLESFKDWHSPKDSVMALNVVKAGPGLCVQHICCFIWNGIPSDNREASTSSAPQGQTCWLIFMAFQLGVYQSLGGKKYSIWFWKGEQKDNDSSGLVSSSQSCHSSTEPGQSSQMDFGQWYRDFQILQ